MLTPVRTVTNLREEFKNIIRFIQNFFIKNILLSQRNGPRQLLNAISVPLRKPPHSSHFDKKELASSSTVLSTSKITNL